MSKKDTALTFPCNFPLKIIGLASSNFLSEITAIILKHYPKTPSQNITYKKSAQDNYMAITAIIPATDQLSLDTLYQEITKHPAIKMVL